MAVGAFDLHVGAVGAFDIGASHLTTMGREGF